MAGPTISESLGNENTAGAVTLTIFWSEASTYVGAAGDIEYTAADGATVYKSSGAPGTGDTTRTHVHSLVIFPTGTPGTASTFTVKADHVNGTGGHNGAILETTPSLAIDHPAPYSRTDISNLNAKLSSQFLGGASISPNDLFGVLVTADINSLAAHLLGTTGVLRKAPKTEVQAYALIDQHAKFNQSAFNPEDYKLLAKSVKILEDSLNARGSTAMTSSGT